MPISKKEFAVENKRLEDTICIIRKKISELGSELFEEKEKVLEFKKFLWDAHAEMDPSEMKSMMSNNDVEISIMMSRGAYLQKLYRIQNKPYFGSIVFQSDDGVDTIYIGITHVEENLNYYVHDWRSPICSMFYDYEIGKACYESPMGTIYGRIQRKRQYTIENGKLIHVFDNEINIDDELLQEVLASESSDKMKNIVNTIQKEQNQVIRNVSDKNLIVQGIAGSGKTSVALHRIAFLLYKITDLSSDRVLIFSPNQVFSEYISNVLPELGEDNTMQTTYHEFLLSYLKEFKSVESFTSFIERYYQKKDVSIDLIRYKQSDEIMKDLEEYVRDFVHHITVVDDIVTRDFVLLKDELYQLLHVRYQHFPFFQRIEVIAEKVCDWYFNGKYQKKKSVAKLILKNLSISKDYIQIYNNFYHSKFCKITVWEPKHILSKKEIAYEDACLFVYLKSLLDGVSYNTNIQQVVIDEAQDYTKMQYYLLTQIFRNANFTILGDIHQTINPYYKYNSLETIGDVFSSFRYLELLKTYRSSEEIITYTNRILNLEHISAIRRSNQKEVIERTTDIHLKKQLLDDLRTLQKDNKSIAIITKTDLEAEKIYNLLVDEVNLVKISLNSDQYDRKLVVLPVYVAKGLEFDAVIVYTDISDIYTKEEKYLFYVACTRCQQQLIVYNQNIEVF